MRHSGGGLRRMSIRYVDLALVVSVVAVAFWLARPQTGPPPEDNVLWAPWGEEATRRSPQIAAWTDDTWPPSDVAPPPAQGPEAYWKAGVARADRELRNGTAMVFAVTPERVAGYAAIDLSTGLPRWGDHRLPHLDGYPTGGEEAMFGGYNERVRQYISLRGLPRNSRKAWIDDILSPARYLRGRATLRLNERQRGPDEFACTLIQRDDAHYLILEGPRGVHETEVIREASETPRVVWGPPGSRTLFVRARASYWTGYKVISVDDGHELFQIGE